MSISILASILLLGTAAVAEHGPKRVETIVATVEAALLPEGRDGVVLQVWGPVAAGTEIWSLKELLLVAPAPGTVVFIDDHPSANFSHPVRYAFVAAGGELGDVVVADQPPRNDADYRPVETEIGRILDAARNRRSRSPALHTVPDDPHRWAVLMNGGASRSSNHVRYWNDLSNIYVALNAVYGFADERIIVLCSDGLDPAVDQSNGENSHPDLDGDGDDDIMFPCDLASVDAVFAQLATILTPQDKLFVFTTDHGGSNGGWNTYFNLWDGDELTDSHFASLLDALPQCKIIQTFEPCFSGGFLDDVVVPPGPRIASSACRHDEYSWAMPPDYVYDTYVFHWTAAVMGEDAYGVPVDADANSDGVVSMEEAFVYAEAHDQSDEDPQYDDYPAGVGAVTTLWPTASGPFLLLAGAESDDIGGNNDGKIDPGESGSLEVTLVNVGGEIATGISGALSTSDTLVEITQASADFPDLDSFESGAGSPPFELDIDADCLIGHVVELELSVSADGGIETDLRVSFMVGDPFAEPTGPDSYGYLACDTPDRPGPLHQWTEIAPARGGPGVLNGPTSDDNPVQLSLPFSFRYYGQDYQQITISPNGWLAMGSTTSTDYTNSAIPNSDGPAAMIAAFWTDLNPAYGGTEICTYHDSAGGWFIVEWFNIAHYGSSDVRETFEVILLDPAHHPTATGDGFVVCLYDQVTDPGGATFGIENENETIGLQLAFDGLYDENVAPIDDRCAILYTADPLPSDVVVSATPYDAPVVVPAQGGTVRYNVAVTNGLLTPVTVDLWSEATLPGGRVIGGIESRPGLTLPAGATGDADEEGSVPGVAPAGEYRYEVYLGGDPWRVWSSSGFDLEKEE